MRRATKAYLRESAHTAAKGIVGGTAIFAVIVFSPALEWAGYRRLTLTEATSSTLTIALVLALAFATDSVFGWLWPKPKS
jgi:hypothetical protein